MSILSIFLKEQAVLRRWASLCGTFCAAHVGYGIIQSLKKRQTSQIYTALAFQLSLFRSRIVEFVMAPRFGPRNPRTGANGKSDASLLGCCLSIQDQRDLELCWWALALALGGESLIALMQYISGNTLGLAFLGELQIEGEMVTSLQRVGGTLGHPNRLAWFLEILLPLTLGLVLLARTRIAWYTALVSFILGCSAMILTGSRGGWISTLVALTFFMVIAVKCHRMQSARSFSWLCFLRVLVIVSFFIYRATGKRFLVTIMALPWAEYRPFRSLLI
jgi:hypothetical protein